MSGHQSSGHLAVLCVSSSPLSSVACFSGTGWGPELEEQLVFPGLGGVSLELFLFLITSLANWGYLNVSVSLHHGLFSSPVVETDKQISRVVAAPMGSGYLGHIFKLLPGAKHQVSQIPTSLPKFVQNSKKHRVCFFPSLIVLMVKVLTDNAEDEEKKKESLPSVVQHL